MKFFSFSGTIHSKSFISYLLVWIFVSSLHTRQCTLDYSTINLTMATCIVWSIFVRICSHQCFDAILEAVQVFNILDCWNRISTFRLSCWIYAVLFPCSFNSSISGCGYSSSNRLNERNWINLILCKNIYQNYYEFKYI